MEVRLYMIHYSVWYNTSDVIGQVTVIRNRGWLPVHAKDLISTSVPEFEQQNMIRDELMPILVRT